MSFHNLGERGPHVTARSADWDAALTDAVTDTDPERRAERIAHWDRLPFARFAHPREEHLLPLMMVLGAAGEDTAVRSHSREVFGWDVSGRWEERRVGKECVGRGESGWSRDT